MTKRDREVSAVIEINFVVVKQPFFLIASMIDYQEASNYPHEQLNR